MAGIGWGELIIYEGFGRLGDDEKDYLQTEYENSKSQYSDYMHASHGMIYAKDDTVLWNLYNTRGAVLMQMRFDGVLGFPGGLIEAGEDPVDGLNREMEEEIGLEVSRHKFTTDHHVQSFVHEAKKLVLHFFAMEVTLSEFCSLESNTIHAPEYGIETMGVVRVPLFTMGDGLRGFPAFLGNQFAGNARSELLYGLEKAQLLSNEELKEAVHCCNKYLAHTYGKKKTD